VINKLPTNKAFRSYLAVTYKTIFIVLEMLIE